MNTINLSKTIFLCTTFVIAILGFTVMQPSTVHAQLVNGVKSEDVVGANEIYLPIVVNSENESGGPTGCAGIQDAINTLPEPGGKVIIASGIFTCTTAIVIDRSNINLEGQGQSTILHLADNANSPVFVLGQTVTPPTITISNIRVANLMIDGNRKNQTEECWTGPCGNGGLTEIRNNGLTLRNVSDVLIENIASNRNRSGGLVTERNSRRITVRNFTASENEFDGIAGYLTEDSFFTELYLHNNIAAGLSFDLDFQHNSISNAVIMGNGSVGIFMIDAHNNLFNNIQIRDSGQHGIFLAQNNTDIASGASGNTFSNLVVSGIGTDGWCVDDSGVYAVCINNASATNNLLIGAQFLNVNGHCVKQPAGDLLTEVGTRCR